MATGARIRHYRLKLGWKLEDLEEASEVSVGTISALEVRDSQRSQFFPAIAKAFGLTLEQLYDTETDWPVVDTRKAAKDKRYPDASDACATLPACEPEPSARRDYLNEAMQILESLPDADLRGAVAALKTHVQNLGPPRNGQALSMAA